MSTATAAVLLALVGPGSAGAGSLDRAALEELFGEPVTASATGSPQRESEVAATMVIITAEEIRRSGARDIPGVLRHVAGIDVLHTSNDHSDVSVRGYNQAFSPRLLVLVDGRQVYADYYGFTPWSTVPVELSAIRQIEVVKGPNSALFGFNAVSGVINIITYDPLDDDVDRISLSAGTQGLLQGSAVSTWKLGESTGVRISAGHRDNDDFSTALSPAEVGARRGNERNAIGLSAESELGENVRLGLDATYSDAGQAEFTPTYTMAYGDYQTRSTKGDIAADTEVGLLQASVYANRIHTDAFLADSQDVFFDFDNHVTVAQLQTVSRIASEHTLRLSAEYRHNTMETTPIGGADVFYDVAALGGMWEWQVDPSVTLTTAIRLDRWSLGRSGSVPDGYGLANQDWDRTETEPSFNAAVVWQATDTDTLRLLIGRGVLVPSLLNLGGMVLSLGPFGYVSGVPDLDPVVVDNYELSWDRTLSALPAELRLSAFHGESSDVLTVSGGVRWSEGIFGFPVNAGDSRTTGFEASIEGTLREEWRWGLSYKGQEIDDDFIAELPLAWSYTDFEDTTPRHVAKAEIGWHRGPWEADGYFRYRSGFQGIEVDPATLLARLTSIPGHLSMDGRLAYSAGGRVTLALSGSNLTRSKQRQTSAPKVERTVLATVSVEFGADK